MNENDRNDKKSSSTEINYEVLTNILSNIANIRSDLDAVKRERDIYDQRMNNWQRLQDEKIEHLKELIKDLELQLANRVSNSDTARLKISEKLNYLEKDISNIKESITEMKTGNKDNLRLWLPIVASFLMCLLSFLLSFF